MDCSSRELGAPSLSKAASKFETERARCFNSTRACARCFNFSLRAGETRAGARCFNFSLRAGQMFQMFQLFQLFQFLETHVLD